MARIRLLHAEQVLVPAHGSSQSQLLVSEEGSTQEKATSNAVDEATSGKEEPVKVVSCPVSLEEHPLLDDALLFSGVETATIDNSELQPGSGWVAVGLACLVSCEVSC